MSVNLKAVPLPPFRSCPQNIPGIPLKMPFGKIRPISCYFLSYSKVGEKCSFVTPKGKNCPGFSCMEVRVFINRFGDGTMENS